ncbi:hypothetical protein LEP1GSC062_0020 [Leptospira alexanderi serovar Manhao 3 str. L 60]|uniref:Uncharacterized protein n=1 Tax=Leptospira alexanderi serovar Manhao 3 str. L 60 TaxID=1049759 RepID=V6HWA2_9LEPT|nr:hypothetical protein LEP1GSC062_0020 [Leptospira alexanderi serovar Manhao 3 str. L 60]
MKIGIELNANIVGSLQRFLNNPECLKFSYVFSTHSRRGQPGIMKWFRAFLFIRPGENLFSLRFVAHF